MESNEVLKQALRKTSPKAVAAELGVSLSLVYKWTEPAAGDGSGSRNPLDRLQKVIELSGDTGIVEWICQQNGGHFVRNPFVDGSGIEHVLTATQEIISQFSELLSQISAAAIDQSAYQATLMNMKFHPSALKTEGDLRKLGMLIRTYFSLGGKHVQFNVVTRETLLAAQANPAEHRDLVVRMAGYSAYFVQLGKTVQDEIIARMENERI